MLKIAWWNNEKVKKNIATQTNKQKHFDKMCLGKWDKDMNDANNTPIQV